MSTIPILSGTLRRTVLDDLLRGLRMGERIALMLESDGPGGAEGVVFSLATQLRDRGVEVIVVVLANRTGWLSSKLREERIELFTPALAHPLDFGFAGTLSRLIRDHRIDLVHSHEFTMGFYGGIAAGTTGRPHVITMHGGRGFANALRRRVALSLAARRASALIGVSDSTCDHLSSSLWMARHRIQLVTNGARFKRGDRAQARAALGVDSGEQLLLSVGNLYPVKGHRVLLDACEILAREDDRQNWRLVIAGRGEEEAALTRLIESKGLQGRVQLLGLRSDISDLLAAADGFILPSLSEGLPLALLEAMFARTPVVCTAVGGIPNIVLPEESGWLVEPGNAGALARSIRELLSDPAHAAKLGKRGHELVSMSYGEDAMVDRYLGVYRSILASSRNA